MTGRVRNHRRAGPVEAVAGIGAVLVCCVGLAFAVGALKAIAVRWPITGGPEDDAGDSPDGSRAVVD
jgi:hypothetical protein